MSETIHEKLGSQQARLATVEKSLDEIKHTVNKNQTSSTLLNERMQQYDDKIVHLHECVHDVKDLMQELRDDARARHKVWVWFRNGTVVVASIVAAAEANVQGWFK